MAGGGGGGYYMPESAASLGSGFGGGGCGGYTAQGPPMEPMMEPSYGGGGPGPGMPGVPGMGSSWRDHGGRPQVPIPAEEIQLEPEYYERIVEVPKVQIENRERIVEVPQPQIVDRIVEIPQVQEVVHEMPGDVETHIITREVPKIEVKQVERIVEVPQIEYQDRYIEVEEVHEVVRRVPRVEVHEIPIERIIRVPKKIIQEIEQPIYRPVPHLVQQRVEREIPVAKAQVQTLEVVRQIPVPVQGDGSPYGAGFRSMQPPPQAMVGPPAHAQTQQRYPMPPPTQQYQQQYQMPSPLQSGSVHGEFPMHQQQQYVPTPPQTTLQASQTTPSRMAAATYGTPPTPPQSSRPLVTTGQMMTLPASQSYMTTGTQMARGQDSMIASGVATGPQPMQSQGMVYTAQPRYIDSFGTGMATALGSAPALGTSGSLSGNTVIVPSAQQLGIDYAQPIAMEQSFQSTPHDAGSSLFDALDRNHDGVITKEELQQVLAGAGGSLPATGANPFASQRHSFASVSPQAPQQNPFASEAMLGSRMSMASQVPGTSFNTQVVGSSFHTQVPSSSFQAQVPGSSFQTQVPGSSFQTQVPGSMLQMRPPASQYLPAATQGSFASPVSPGIPGTSGSFAVAAGPPGTSGSFAVGPVPSTSASCATFGAVPTGTGVALGSMAGQPPMGSQCSACGGQFQSAVIRSMGNLAPQPMMAGEQTPPTPPAPGSMQSVRSSQPVAVLG